MIENATAGIRTTQLTRLISVLECNADSVSRFITLRAILPTIAMNQSIPAAFESARLRASSESLAAVDPERHAR